MANQAGDETVDLTGTLAKVSELISEESPIMQGFEDQFEALAPDLRALQAMLKGAEAQAGSNDEDMNLLMGKMRKVALSAQTHIEDFIVRREKQMKTGQFKKTLSILRNTKAQKDFIQILKITAAQIPHLIAQGREQGLASTSDPSVGLHTWNEPDSLVGREENMQILVHYLLSEKRYHPSTVTILGVNGVGKTALASMVYKNAMIASHFPCRAWVTMPLQQEFEPEEILHSIAKQVSLDYSEGDRMQNIELVLSSMGRYLIVLDDVSTPKIWRLLQKVLPITCSGVVIITSQVREVALEASSRGLIHELQLLSPEESWELFCTKLGDLPQGLVQLGKDFVKHCKGLPLTISETVGILSQEAKTVERWSWLLLELQQKGSIKHVAGDALPSNVKKCLYYFLLFDEDYEIPVRRLIALWLAEGFVQPEGVDDDIPLELAAKKYLTVLENRTVIQVLRRKLNGDSKTCCLHRVIRDMLLPQAATSHFFYERSSKTVHIQRHAHHPEREDASSSYREASYRNQQTSSTPNCYKAMRSFLSFDPREGRDPGEHIRDFLSRGVKIGAFKRLRVLDLEGVFRPSLPEMVLKELHRLRYLGLRRTYSESIPASVGCLQKLQTLDLKYTCISSVPSSIWKLKKLRHIYLSQNYRTKLPSPSTASAISPTDLQTLSGGYVDDQSLIRDGIDRLKNLRKLALTCQMTASNQKALAEWIADSLRLESLKLRSIDKLVQASDIYLEHLSGLPKLTSLYLFGKLANPSILSSLTESLAEITLSLSNLEQDPMVILGVLPNLRILALLSDSYTGKTMMCPSSSFKLLRFLKFWKLSQLEEWTVAEGAMPLIEAIEIRSCLRLKSFPSKIKHLMFFQ